MGNETAPAPKRRLTARGRVLRRGRIFARLREGWAYDEIAEDEGVTAERIRQIVREALEKRLLDQETDHAKLQLARLQPALRIAAETVADGHVHAINPLLKVLDRLDRYQRTAKVNQVYDDEARKKLMDKLNRVAANLGFDKAIAASKAAEAQSQDSGAPEEEKEKTPWGVGASP
jgi:predicted transcriptional regulator